MTLLNHNEAIARVTVDGLGLCCFNSQEKKWDLAFLRLPEPSCHYLILSVEGQEPILVDGGASLISFETIGGRFPAGFPRGFFDNGPISNRTNNPSAGPERENFRWVLDLESDIPHGFVGLKKPQPPMGLTRTYIHNAVFYTLDVSPQDLILLHNTPTEDPNLMIKPPRFGRTNDEISADIFCDAGGQVVVKIDNVEKFRLDDRPGNPWKICLTNLCLRVPPTGTKFGKGDFQVFYEVLEISGEPYALWGEPVPGLAQCHTDPSNLSVSFGPVNMIGRPDCDTTRLGTVETLDPLFS